MDGYRRALTLYTGDLLPGRETDYSWVGSLRDDYRRRQRRACQRLAELLRDAGRPGEAASLFGDLMHDPGPPDRERDGGDEYGYRESCARAVFACCRQLGDLVLLGRTYQELVDILHELDAEAGADETVQLSRQTTLLFEEIEADLTRRGAAAAGD